MRTKDEILQESSKAVVEAPKEAQQMIAHEYLMLEVFIDIRDILQYHLLRIGDLYSAFKEKD